ncbi:Docking protein 3 [Merluccius polli]|uniref:Docking protein 3 n=1 Tax=Merluccius polli TaxID=89951 RepID=A0AA47M5A7_MERPO|nr:Docking protein 3 [Merluccius polli]
MEIFKEGLLYLHGVKFGKKTWQKIWMIILKPQTLEVGRLEVYILPNDITDDMLPPEPDKTGRRVVLLSDCLGITLAPEEACPPGCTAFYLDTTLRTYTLASEACQDWLLALCQLTFQDPGEEAPAQENSLLMKDNDLYSGFGDQPQQYHVTVLDTEASERCLLAGDFTFLLDREATFLLDKDKADIIYRWPYIFLRRFGILMDGFCIEAGHQCDSGEGMFSFLSQQGRQVCQAIARHCLTDQETIDSFTPAPDCKNVLLNEVQPSPGSGSDPPDSSSGVEARLSLASHHYAEVNFSASHHQSVPSATSHTLSPPSASAPVPVKPPRRTTRLSSKGTRKTKTMGGPVDRSPSGPQKGAPLSFKQKLSKLISIDLAKIHFPRRLAKGKS